MTATPRQLSGDEEIVLFADQDEFIGVGVDWLRPRLRLDPELGFVDFFETGGPVVYVDDEIVEDLDMEVILGPGSALCRYGNDNIIGGSYDLWGEWIEAWAAEIRWNVTYIGPGPHDFHALALTKIREGMDSWEPQADEVFVASSPFLDPDRPEDRETVLTCSCESGTVLLNDVRIR